MAFWRVFLAATRPEAESLHTLDVCFYYGHGGPLGDPESFPLRDPLGFEEHDISVCRSQWPEFSTGAWDIAYSSLSNPAGRRLPSRAIRLSC
jgi:hypothetical protein